MPGLVARLHRARRQPFRKSRHRLPRCGASASPIRRPLMHNRARHAQRCPIRPCHPKSTGTVPCI